MGIPMKKSEDNKVYSEVETNVCYIMPIQQIVKERLAVTLGMKQ